LAITLFRRIGGRLLRLLPLLWLASAAASERLDVSLGSIAGDGWRAEGVRVALDLQHDGSRIQIDRLLLPQPVGELRNLTATCANTSVTGPAFACRGGQFQLDHPWFDPGTFRGDLSLDRRSGRLSFTLSEIALAGGRLRAEGSWRQGEWQVQGHAVALDLARLKALVASFAELPPGSAAGRADVQYRLRGAGPNAGGHLALALTDLTAASDDGRYATEGLAARVRADLRKRGPDLFFMADGESKQGQLYADPVFVDSGDYPFGVRVNGRWNAARGELQLTDLRLDQPKALTAEATLRWQRGEGVQDLQLLIEDAVLPGAYQLYAQPFLIGALADSLVTEGRLNGIVSMVDGKPQAVRLALADVGAADNKGRFALQGLAGVLRWQAQALPGAPPTELRWQSGAIGGVPLGASRLRLQAAGNDVELLDRLRLPILDGALNINRLRVARAGQPNMALAFDAELTPIELGAVSRALGWPELRGTVAGRLPSLRYEDGQLTVGGQLEVEAFDGRIRVDHLQLHQPFGKVPRLGADIVIDDLDLKTLTEAFAFGRIEGRLSGRIDRLRLANWQPASFDARFYTPPGDRSRHRISQRAIQNLSSIGGNDAAAILSRGFLRVFEDFAYDRIGLRCRLEEDVCQMSGIAPAADGGYYIVRGKLLPRVDVIGFQREVSWPTLVEQLKSVIESEGPVVR
jgi:hypothetical protein